MSAVAPDPQPTPGGAARPSSGPDTHPSARGPESPAPPRAIRLEARLWLAQRVSAIVLAFCVVVHLITIALAVKSGLTAGAILGRLRGSPAWLVFYVVFVAAVAVHASIGLRAIAAEWLGWRGRFLNAATFLTGALLLALGLRAITGLFGGAA